MPETGMITEEEGQKTRALQTSQGLVRLSDVDILMTKETIEQAEKLVASVLEPEIDFGLHPGTNSIAVKDSGAAKIYNGFNTFPEHVILHITEKDDLISYLVQAKLVHRISGAVVGSGVGACSTMESKYAYRWVRNPEEYGFDRKSLRYDKERKKWRITNPEIEDLGNTILKMASKRSELDAANSLPGVASGLKKLFLKYDKEGNHGKGKAATEPRWATFWSEVGALGLAEDQVHEMLGVKSMKDWLSSGKGLNEAIQLLAKKVSEQGESTKVEEPEARPGDTKPKRDPKSIKTVSDLLRVCNEDFGLQPGTVYAELNVSSASQLANDIEEKRKTLADCYTQIAAIYSPQH
jgi:hypothetical protein